RQVVATRPVGEPPGRPRSSESGDPPTFRMCGTSPEQLSQEGIMPKSKTVSVTRRQILKDGGAATFAGYAVGVEKALGQAIKTDTQGIVAADAQVPIGSYNKPGDEGRPGKATNA